MERHLWSPDLPQVGAILQRLRALVMSGLKRIDPERPTEVFDLMVLWPIEQTTNRLNRGDAFTSSALNDMMKLRRRLDAFGAALDRRMRTEGVTYKENQNETP